MRFMIMHKASAADEAGRLPTPELIAEVGKMVGNMARAGVLQAGEGLRPSAEGVRLTFHGGRQNVAPGPFKGGNELISGFAIVKVKSLDDAIAWATRYAQVVGDSEIDIRPLTEPWHLGVAAKPPGLETTRFMLAHKADAASEAGKPVAPEKVAAMGALIEEMKAAGVLQSTEGLAPSAKAVRLRFSRGKSTVTDGPFAESKELIGGFVIVEAPSRAEAIEWTQPYGMALGDVEIDVRAMA